MRLQKKSQIEESSDSSESPPPPSKPDKPYWPLSRAMLNPTPEPRAKNLDYVPKLVKIKVEPKQD